MSHRPRVRGRTRCSVWSALACRLLTAFGIAPAH